MVKRMVIYDNGRTSSADAFRTDEWSNGAIDFFDPLMVGNKYGNKLRGQGIDGNDLYYYRCNSKQHTCDGMGTG